MEAEAPEKIRVLYVDDEEPNLAAFRSTFRRDFEVHIATSGAEGMRIMEEKDIQVIVTDQRMPEMTGVEFLASVLQNFLERSTPAPTRILLTGYSDMDAVVAAVNEGKIYKYLSKPWDEQMLRETIEEAYEVYRLQKEKNELTRSLLRVNKQLEFMLRQKLIS